MLSGVVAGLVAITPAAGFVDPKGAVIIGLIAGPACYASSVWIKKLLRYDDSLDAFGIHGAGGLIGALLTGVFAHHGDQQPVGRRQTSAPKPWVCCGPSFTAPSPPDHPDDLQVHHGTAGQRGGRSRWPGYLAARRSTGTLIWRPGAAPSPRQLRRRLEHQKQGDTDMTKNLLRTAAAAAAATAAIALSGPASAQSDVKVAWNVGVVSDYIFRGVSQTGRGPGYPGRGRSDVGQLLCRRLGLERRFRRQDRCGDRRLWGLSHRGGGLRLGLRRDRLSLCRRAQGCGL